jgi:hypothetical protein
MSAPTIGFSILSVWMVLNVKIEHIIIIHALNTLIPVIPNCAKGDASSTYSGLAQ